MQIVQICAQYRPRHVCLTTQGDSGNQRNVYTKSHEGLANDKGTKNTHILHKDQQSVTPLSPVVTTPPLETDY